MPDFSVEWEHYPLSEFDDGKFLEIDDSDDSKDSNGSWFGLKRYGDLRWLEGECDKTYQDENGMEVLHRTRNPVDMGRHILLEFPSPEIYSTAIFEEDEKRDIFDDGLGSDVEDYSYDSDTSCEMEDSEEPVSKDNALSDAFDSEGVYTSGFDDEMNPVNSWATPIVENEKSAENKADPTASSPPPAAPNSFAELQQKKDKHMHDEVLPHDKEIENLHMEILGLEEENEWIEQEIPVLEDELEDAQTLRGIKEQEITTMLNSCGIPAKLRAAYEAFCESLVQKYGQRGRFSITCEGKHQGSYVKYDPEFELFKEFNELPESTYKRYNYRCEPSAIPERSFDHFVWNSVDFVEFFPLKSPNLKDGVGFTWGAQYVSFTLFVFQSILTSSQSPSFTNLLAKLFKMVQQLPCK